MAARRAAALGLRRLASASAAASSRPVLLVAPLRSLLQPTAAVAADPYARRGYAVHGGAGRNARAVSEDEDDDDGDELEAMGSDEELDGDFDDEDLEDFDDEDGHDDAPPKRGRRG